MTTPARSAPPPDASPAGSARRPRTSVPLGGFRRLLPARSVLGFVALLALLFALAYAVGGAVGPVAPGLRPDRRPGSTEPPGGGGSGGGMPGMAGMSALGQPRAAQVAPATGPVTDSGSASAAAPATPLLPTPGVGR
ncbi:hypothetical protein K2224_21120 [Streptomyces sp. BHT-5-2]|uniref:hypothetical protein n=1 Tax=unclassified Streptomyces TaxID=2593676 RepID=UPI001C8D10AC|nr:hypothetical protein [Streptomyces sp. BHT-5-2]QZL05328.1 hypothetical protein K2224_21120 [Streptomyces sp. BHT-5-2]